MAGVEIVLGDRWKDDVLHLSSLRHRRPSDAAPRLSEFRDVFDLVIHGTNWTSDIHEEHIFSLLSEFVSSLEALMLGDSVKEVVEFPSAPYELTLHACGDLLKVSLLSVDQHREVIAYDVGVSATEFAHAVARAGEGLLADLIELDDHYASDPFVRTFGAAIARILRMRRIMLGRDREFPPLELAASTSIATARGDLTLSYDVGVTSAFQAYDAEPAFDWHALLLPGSVHVEANGHLVGISGRFPVLALPTLLQRVRELLNVEEAARAHYVTRSAHAVFALECEVAHGQVTLRFGMTHGIVIDVGLHQAIDVLLSFARLLLDDLARLNPAISRNARFEDLSTELLELERWFQDLRLENQYLDRPEAFIASHAEIRPDEAPDAPATFGWPLRDVRAVYPKRRWAIAQNGIHFAGVTLSDALLFVPSVDGLAAYHADSGASAWTTVACGGAPLSSYAVAGEYLVVANERGHRSVLRAADAAEVGHFPGTSPLLVRAASYPTEQIVVAADYRGTLCGYDLEAGTVWETRTGQGVLTDAVFSGPLIALFSAPGILQAFEPTRGEALWKVRTGGPPEAGPFAHEGRLYTLSLAPSGDATVLHCFHPFTGRVAWTLTLQGRLLNQPSFVEGFLVAVVEVSGHAVLVGVELETAEFRWRHELLTAGLDRPTAPLHAAIDGTAHVLVRTDRAELSCVRVADGALVWQYRAPVEDHALLVRTLPIFCVRDAILCASERLDLHDLRTGELLHQFADVFEAPEFLHATGALHIYVGEAGDLGAPDHLTCFGLEHFLALVR